MGLFLIHVLLQIIICVLTLGFWLPTAALMIAAHIIFGGAIGLLRMFSGSASGFASGIAAIRGSDREQPTRQDVAAMRAEVREVERLLSESQRGRR